MAKQFYSIKEEAIITGLSIKLLRKGCKAGTIPHIRVGEGENARFMINHELFAEQLKKESLRHE